MKLLAIMVAWSVAWFGVCCLLAISAMKCYALPKLIINAIAQAFWMAGMAACLTLVALLMLAGV